MNVEGRSFDAAFNDKEHPWSDVADWQSLSLHQMKWSVLFGTVADRSKCKDKQDTSDLVKQIRDPLSKAKFFMRFGKNVNESAGKGLGVNAMRAVIDEGADFIMEDLLDTDYAAETLQVVLTSPHDSTKRFEEHVLQKLHVGLMDHWTENNT